MRSESRGDIIDNSTLAILYVKNSAHPAANHESLWLCLTPRQLTVLSACESVELRERTLYLLGTELLFLGLVCFVGGAAMLVNGAPVDATIYALGLIFVGSGTSLRDRNKTLLT